MKKCCFIIPYFGKLPNYFQLFLKSCEYNPTFNWIVFTDDKTGFHYPDNVKRVEMTFLELRDLVQSKFDFPISLARPYKLCDYKPAYGYIFEDYLQEFGFWGHCDTDVLMGDLSHFLTKDFLNGYDKVFCLGHMTIYRNSFENNRVFMKTVRDMSLYKRAFSTDSIVTFDEEWRDENNVNRIFLENNKKIYQKDLSLNFSIYHTRFRKITFVGFDTKNDGHGYLTEKYQRSLCVWDQGHVYRYVLDNDKLKREEYIYIHLQKRKMVYDSSIIELESIKIVPNRFLPIDNYPIDLDSFKKEKVKYSCSHYYSVILKPKIERKIKNVFHIFKMNGND